MHVADQENKAVVLIDLTARLDVRKLNNKSELIQQQALDRLAGLIINRLADPAVAVSKSPDPEDLDADGSNILFDRRHDTIVIHGSRGSGKTTFIRNAFRLFRKDEDYRAKIGAKVAMLGVVDPTLIENKENTFVVILNKIKRAVERHRNSVGDRSPCGDDFTEWQKKLRSLAQGLALLDGIGPDRALGDSWDDVQYVLRKGLDKADAGSELETRFHDFVKSSLDYIGKQAFLIALDDIDTNFRRGWPVLEVLRRYLTSPRFIVVLSGDMDLYTLLVRGKQWDQFSERQLSHDKTQEPGLREMVNHLQAQYLLKVLPPRNRIPLLPLGGMENDIHLLMPTSTDVSSDAAERMTLKDCLEIMFQKRLGLGGHALRNTVAMLLRLPVRTVLQVLSLYPTSTRDRPWAELANGLPAIFLDTLLRHNTSLDELYQSNGDRAVGCVAKFLTQNRLWENAQDLLPEHTEDDLNTVLLTIGTWLRGQCLDHPELGLEYMLRICFAHEILTNHLLTSKAAGRDTADGTVPIEDFIRFTELERNGSSLEVVRLFVSVINGDSQSGLRLGTVQTLGRGSRSSRQTLAGLYGSTPRSDASMDFDLGVFPEDSLAGPYLKNVLHTCWTAGLDVPSFPQNVWYNTIDTLRARLTSETMRALVGLPTCRVLKNGERPTYVSVHSIIAIVSELLRRALNGNNDGIVRILRDSVNIRAYPIPPWLSRNAAAPELEQQDDSELLTEEEEVNEIRVSALTRAISVWVSDAKKVSPPPPYVLARIWARFHYALVAIDDVLPRRERYLGNILHRQIVAFFNALLVEEMIYLGVEGINLRNPVTSDRVFQSNLALLKPLKDAQQPKFFWAIYRCPLWSAYLNLNNGNTIGPEQFKIALNGNESALHAEYAIRILNQDRYRRENVKADGPVTFMFENLYELLNSVPVVGGGFRIEEERPEEGTKTRPARSPRAPKP